MIVIAAVDKNWAIGNKNKLLVSIPNDMKRFRAFTTDNIVVMGRKTLESFPGGRPLPQRLNIVLTKDKDYDAKGATVVTSIDELKEVLDTELKNDLREVFVIGGESIYRQLLPMCDKAYLTMIDNEYEADTFFPNLDNEEGWEVTERSEEQTCFDICYEFVTYERK